MKRSNRQHTAAFGLIELSLGIGLGMVLSVGSLMTLNAQGRILAMQINAQGFTTMLPQLRNVLEKTAGQASRVRVFADSTGARGTGNAATTSGSAVRLEYLGGANTPAGSAWSATLEYRPAEERIYYRNSGGAEWVAATNLSACTFSIVEGALRVNFTTRTQTADCYLAVN